MRERVTDTRSIYIYISMDIDFTHQKNGDLFVDS